MESLKDAIEQLESKLGKSEPISSDDLTNLRSKLKELIVNSDQIEDLKRLSLQLWNCGVQITNKDLASLEINVQVRHFACDCLSLAAANSNEADEETYLTLMNFFARTGKLWSDLKNFAMAETCYSTSLDFWDRLKKMEIELSPSDSLKSKRTLYSLFCWRAESSWEMDQKDVTYSLVARARLLLDEIPNESRLLGEMCYKLAVETKKRRGEGNEENEKEKGQVIQWLEEAFQVTEKEPQKDFNFQSKILRWLAIEYLEMNQIEKAIQSISIANSLQLHPAGFLVLSKIYMKQNNIPMASESLFKTLKHKDVSLETCLSVCHSAFQFKCFELGMQGLEYLSEKYCNHPNVGKVKLTQFQYLISPTVSDFNRASSLLQEIISKDKEGSQKLGNQIRKQFYLSIWNLSFSFFSSGDFRNCALWINRLLLFLPSDDHQNRAKAFRMIGKCYLSLGEHEIALEAASNASEIEPDSCESHYLLFKIFLAKGDSSKGIEEMKKICGSKEYSQGYLEMCAMDSFEGNNHECTRESLELLFFQNQFEENGQFGILWRNLVKTLLSSGEEDLPLLLEKAEQLVNYLSFGVQQLEKKGVLFIFNNNLDEVRWFFNVSFNAANKSIKKSAELSHKFFHLAYQISLYLPETISNMEMTKGCLLSSTASIVKQATGEKEEQKVTSIAKQALLQIEQVRILSKKILVQKGSSKETEDKTSSILTLLQFKCLALLKDPNLLQFIQKMIGMEGMDATFFESIAEICRQSNTLNVEASEEALKICIRHHLQEKPIDWSKCCDLFRKLILLCQSREQSLPYYQQLVKLTEGLDDHSLSPIQLQWLFVTAWNNGVYFYKLMNYEYSEKWMGISLGLVKKHPNAEEYLSSMSSAYSQVLKQVQSKDNSMEICDP